MVPGHPSDVHRDAMSENGLVMERSPADVVRLVSAAAALIALLLIEWLFGSTLVAFGTDLLRGLDALPSWIVDVVIVGSRLLAVVLLGGGFLWVVSRQRWAMLARVVAAGLLAAVLVKLVIDLVEVDSTVAPVDVKSMLRSSVTEGFHPRSGSVSSQRC